MKAKDIAVRFNDGEINPTQVYTIFANDLVELIKYRPAIQGSAAAGLYRELCNKVSAFLVRLAPDKRSQFPKNVEEFINKIGKTTGEIVSAWIPKARNAKLNDGLYAVAKGYREPNKVEKKYMDEQRKKAEEAAQKQAEADKVNLAGLGTSKDEEVNENSK